MDYRVVSPALAPGDDGEPPSLDSVQVAIGEVFDAYQASRYGYVTT